MEKYCKNCQTTKPFTDFNKSSKNKDGHQLKCRECEREYHSRPEISARNKQNAKNRRKDPEFLRKEREQKKIYRSNPENKRKFNEWLKEYRKTPEAKAKFNEA